MREAGHHGFLQWNHVRTGNRIRSRERRVATPGVKLSEPRRQPHETSANAVETLRRELGTVTEGVETVRRRKGGRRNVSRDESSGPGGKDSDPGGRLPKGEDSNVRSGGVDFESQGVDAEGRQTKVQTPETSIQTPGV